MNEHTTDLLQTFQSWILATVIFLMPVFFLPFTADFYELNKQMLLLLSVFLLTLLFGIRLMLTKTFVWHKTPFTLPLGLFLLAALASVFFASINKIEAWTTPLGVGSILLLTAFSFLLSQQNEQGKKIIAIALTASGVLLSLILFQQFVGVLGSLFSKTPFLQDRAWSPTGSVHVSLIYLVAVVTITIPKIIAAYKKEKTVETAVYAFSIIVMLLASAISLYQMIGMKRAIFLPQQTGWFIALESLKNNLLFGYGPENFLSAFTATKPVNFNLSDYWNLRFITSSNLYFHIWTTMGVLGLGAFVLFLLQVLKNFKNAPTQIHKNTLPLVLVLLLGFIFPPSFLFLFLIYVLAGLHSAEYEHSIHKLAGAKLYAAFTLPLIVLVFLLLRASFVYAADMTFKSALDAFVKNDATKTYDGHRAAIRMAPWKDTYRSSLSQVNVALANAIAKKGELTDQDRTTLSQLLQQSIQEAKNAIVLNPTRVTNWENLAIIYKGLMNVVKDADQWAVATYNQAIQLDPFNPVLRLELGGIFYTRKNYDVALQHFASAAQLKPNFANARYNLASLYKEKKEYAKAIAEMEAVLAIVKPGSQDAATATKELEELKKALESATPPTTTSGTGETLTPPDQNTPAINPPLDLPDSAAPPATESGTPEASPTPSTTPSSSASPRPSAS